ncbi:PIN domain-containing protein [Candidatus Methylospira mobilis]|uniref:PIN domain-containing protein n=1 Tax=Candidatus Methylospira mobilis TaxID=1808979 RepID=UPI0028E5C64B|nr:PIN domain-containing protein [Candidatus Methylospira mobilis]WNV04106.1 PIN domain-containing protein [Candidatus Methylospira mobilis]
MTARFFADTNIPVYALSADAEKRKKALALLRRNPVISVQVVNEFITVAVNKMKLTRPDANRLASVMMKRCEVVPMDAAMVAEAISLGERLQLSHWDSLIVAAALRAGCDALYSEDMQHGQLIDNKMTILNPFC